MLTKLVKTAVSGSAASSLNAQVAFNSAMTAAIAAATTAQAASLMTAAQQNNYPPTTDPVQILYDVTGSLYVYASAVNYIVLV